MITIPLIDIREQGPYQLVLAHPERARDLIAGSRRTLGLLSDIVARLVLPTGDRISRDWLSRTRNPYLAEIDRCAARLGVPGVYALNCCFEWGCTSTVHAGAGGPTLARALDWIFPRLGENVVVAHQRGVIGDFYNVTWPGMSGVFQAMAPGRFAAAINQAPMRRHRRTFVGDWAVNRRQVFRTSALPPAHRLRDVCETARDYAEAVKRLAETPIALPAIFILAGTAPGEGCVIERTEDAHRIRPLDGDRVCASNQFDTDLDRLGHGWRARPIDSAGRVRDAWAMPAEAWADGFNWFRPPIANSHTRLAMTACAATGTLSVFGTRGVERVSEILTVESR